MVDTEITPRYENVKQHLKIFRETVILLPYSPIEKKISVSQVFLQYLKHVKVN